MNAHSIQVSDLPSNFPEQLEFYAQHLTAPQRRKVFEEVYRGHKKPRFVSELSKKTKLVPVRVAQEAAKLADIGLLLKGRDKNPTSKKSETYYEKRPEIAVHRRRLLRLATNSKAREELVTKRRPMIKQVKGAQIVRVEFPSALVRVQHITIDEIDSFRRVADYPPAGAQLKGVTENKFKKGIQNIIGERATFKDWGGERSDLMTTRVKLGGRRIRAAFMFKGPGQTGKLTIARMGKNGDQGPRLFEESADLYVVQHWREIDSQVYKFVETLAIAKSVTVSSQIRYCLIDGQDSDRIFRAYRTKF